MTRKVSAARARNNPIPGVGKNIAKVSFQGASMPELPVATKLQRTPIGGPGANAKAMDNRIGGMQTLPGFAGTVGSKHGAKLNSFGDTNGGVTHDKAVTKGNANWPGPKALPSAFDNILSVKTKMFNANKGPMTKNAPIGAKGMPSSFSRIQNVGAPRIFGKGGITGKSIKLKGN